MNHTATGNHRGLGRDTDATVKAWDRIVANTRVARPSFGAVAGVRKSPNIRRFWYDAYQDQRSKGYCVGFNLNGTVMTLLRIPSGAGPDSLPLGRIRLSPLYCYDVMRREAREEGYNLGWGDGGIASAGIRAVHRFGVALWEHQPSDARSVDSHQNDATPPKVASDFGVQHVVKDFGIAESWEAGLALNKAGFPLAVASDIPSGMMTTDAQGRFRMRGGIVGGHEYQLIDHDEDADTALIGQSWYGWGERSGDPAHAERGGVTQLGTCPLSELATYFGARAMASGASEITVANTVTGFAPIISFDGLAPPV